MVRFSNSTMVNQLKDLWKEAFMDPNAYIELIFNQKYKPSKTLVEVVSGSVLAALHMSDYKFGFYKSDVGVSYISGVATKKSARGQGSMRRILNKALKTLYNEQKLFSVLIPGEHWLYGLYRKFGFAACFYLEKQSVSLSDLKPDKEMDIKKYTENDFLNLYSYYTDYFKNIDFTIKKSKQDLKIVVADHYLGQGEIFTAWDKGKISGVCFAILRKDACVVKEVLSDSEDVRQKLIEHSAKHFNCEKITVFNMASSDKLICDLQKSGMIRIINAYKVLQIFAAKNQKEKISFNVSDDILKINCGFYTIEGGKVIKTAAKDEGIEINIEQLAEYLFGFNDNAVRKYLYMNLMLN